MRKDSTGANGDAEVQTLPEYRDKYALYHSDANLRALRAAHPLLAIWDDHEVEDNWAARQARRGAPRTRACRSSSAAPTGFKAFFEHMPRAARRRATATASTARSGSAPTPSCSCSTSAPTATTSRAATSSSPPAPTARRPGRTLLGAAQKEWLVDALARSGATWKVVGNQVMIMSLDLPAGNAINPDQWDGYAAERREILERVRDAAPRTSPSSPATSTRSSPGA